MKFAVSGEVGDSAAQSLASFANAVLIQVLNDLYVFVAGALSEWENHRTDTEVSPCSLLTNTFH